MITNTCIVNIMPVFIIEIVNICYVQAAEMDIISDLYILPSSGVRSSFFILIPRNK